MNLISLEELGYKPSKQKLGKARRKNLEVILAEILVSSDDEVRLFLKSQHLNKSMLCEKIGLNIKPVNLRQSFKDEIVAAEKKLIERGLIVDENDKPSESCEENGRLFNEWIDEKLRESEFIWPINHNNMLYRRAIWALFTEQKINDVDRTPSLFSRSSDVQKKLSDIDLRLVNNELAFQSYASESALDEMQDTMTNRAILTLNQKVKTLSQLLASERLEKEKFAKELNKLKHKNKSLLSGDIESIKLAGAH